MNKSRKAARLHNVISHDNNGNVTLPADLSLSVAPHSSDNSSRVATTAWIRAYVGTQFANIVETAPAALDTLTELAAALGNDPNFATTVATSIGTRVPQTRTITINGVSFDLSADRSWSIAAGVTSFNTRTGAITLLSADVTGALGFTPYNATNPSGYLTASTVLNTVLTPYVVGANTAVSASDTIETAIEKLQGQVNARLTSYTETDTLATVTGRGATTSSIINSTYNTASGRGNLGFLTSASTVGNIHIQNGSGPGADNSNQAAITFQGNTSSQAQAGIYVLNNGSYGTSMGFATTNSYAAGPQLFMTAENTGQVNFPRSFVSAAGDFRAPIFYDSNNTTYYLDPTSSGTSLYMNGGIVTTAPGGTVLIKHAVSEVDAWIFQENAANWGLYWKNNPSGNHTFGGYTTVGAELFGMSAANSSGNGVTTTNFVGATSAIAQWMLSNYTGYIWSASTVFAAGDMRAPVFYDSNNTGFYYDGASGTNLNYLNVNGTWGSSPFGNGTAQLNINGTYPSITQRQTDLAQGYWLHHVDANGQYNLYGGRGSTNGSDWNWAFRAFTTQDGNRVEFRTDVRAPIFYDSNNTAYYIDGASTSDLNALKLNALFLDRNESASRGISWYASSFTAWSQYMSPPGATGCGPTGNITAPSGAIVTSWALRSFIENEPNYGWTFESGSSSGQPSVVAEIRSSDGSARFAGAVTTTNVNAPSGYSSFGNPWGTSNSAFFPNGITTAGSTNWIYGSTTHIGNATGNGAGHDFYSSGSSYSTGNLETNGSFRAPIFYDRNNTGYYVDPNSSTQLRTVYADDWFRPQGCTGVYWQSYGRGMWSPECEGNTYGSITTYGTGRNGWQGWGIGSRHVFMSTGGDNVGVHDNSRGWIWYWTGSSFNIDHGFTTIAGSTRSPIFYDSANTGYYLDPNGASYLASSLEIANGYVLTNGVGGSLNMNSAAGGFGGYFQCARHLVIETLQGGHHVYVLDASGVGVVKLSGSQSWAAHSDRRIKTVHSLMENNLSKLESINPIYYSFNNFADDKNRIGLIAQEVQAHFPELVATDPKTDNLILDYTGLIPVLIGAIKELKNKVETLETQLS